ncbi:MaoC family dehydratase N-terminal domain-containing protein [Phytomonospora sp. NPDC050363]|uniref:FAS1-like dehydratase domain-containing protein n=1 Tax=Phytomonospora sp. NPDC050363 TaxID=3155642 RepID=UPI0033E51DD7
MLNTSYVGRTLPATEPHVVTAEEIGAFAAALGAKSDRTTASPTFLVSHTLPASNRLVDDPEFGLDFTRVLHREQRFAHVRPVRAGDEISCLVHVESIKTVAGNDVLTTRTEVTVGGDLVSTVWTTLFVRGDL